MEMAAAFDAAGFSAVDVHMSDLIEQRVQLNQFQGFVADGFKCIVHNDLQVFRPSGGQLKRMIQYGIFDIDPFR